jgi:hypothetical protein
VTKKEFTITPDPTMILEDNRRIVLLYFEYKNSKLKNIEIKD